MSINICDNFSLYFHQFEINNQQKKLIYALNFDGELTLEKFLILKRKLVYKSKDRV